MRTSLASLFRSSSAAPERALVHPVWWMALAVLAFNDHVLKGSGLLPDVVTGKLSDVAGLIVAPLLFATVVRARGRRAMAACHLAVGAVFAAIQVSAPAAAGWSALMGAFGFPWVIVSDPTDLLALPALGVSWWVLVPTTSAASPMWVRRGAERLSAALGLVCCIATSPPMCDDDECPEPCFDGDGDGVCAEDDCDDSDPRYAGDVDGDGVCGGLDCDDFDRSVVSLDEDGDGVCSDVDCDDFDPNQQYDCCFDFDRDGVCADDDCDDGDPTVGVTCNCSLPSSVIPVEGLVLDLSAPTAARPTPACLGGASEPQALVATAIAGLEDEARWVTVEATADDGAPVRLVVGRACELDEPALCEPEGGTHAVAVAGGGQLYLHVSSPVPATRAILRVVDEPLSCGDGLRVGPEQCDDGNLMAGDGCDAACQLE
ncbi:MAG: DUF4215 domain-containing protein [Myxococcota bacterium]